MDMLNIQGFLFLIIAIIYVLIDLPIIAVFPAALGIICFIRSTYKKNTRQ